MWELIFFSITFSVEVCIVVLLVQAMVIESELHDNVLCRKAVLYKMATHICCQNHCKNNNPRSSTVFQAAVNVARDKIDTILIPVIFSFIFLI